jgi:hypothetical protein
MTTERSKAIIQLVEGWNETDQYEEDFEKTAVVQELLAMVRACPKPLQEATARKLG